MQKYIWWLLLVVLWSPAAPARDDAEQVPLRVVESYLAAIMEARWTDARALWLPEYLEQSQRLGITYLNQPCPWDLASPAVLFRKALQTGTARYSLKVIYSDPYRAEVALRVHEGDQEHTARYGIVRRDGRWLLTSPIWLAGQEWAIRSTRYCRLHVQNPGLLNDVALRELDRFIADSARFLGASPERLLELQHVKLPYYLADEATVAALTGYPTKGMADLAGGAVISSHFPHFHELAHLLINWVLTDVPVYTLPWLQEGLACRLGGRWGRSPEVVLYTGWVNLEMEMITAAEVLTRAGFHSAAAGPDGSYGVSALLCDLIQGTAGWPALVELYQDLSGDLASVDNWDENQIATAVAQTCGWNVPDPLRHLTATVNGHRDTWRRCGIEPGSGEYQAEVLGKLSDAAESVTVTLSARTWNFRVQPRTWPAVILLDNPVDHVETDAGRISSLYNEHLPDARWGGSRWGVVCRPSNVGLYDYATNRLVHTWVAGFTAEPELASAGQEPMVFRLVVPAALAAADPGELTIRLP